MFLERIACTLGVYVCAVCTQCAVSLADPPRTARQCYCSCVRPSSSSSSSPDSHFRCFPASALLLYFSPPFFSSSFPAHILLLFFPRFSRLSPSTAVLPTFFEFMPTKRMTDNPTWLDRLLTPSLTPCSHWPLPWQRSDWVGLPTSCLVSQTVILRVCFVGMTLGTSMGVCACIVTFVCMVCFLWMSAG